MSFGLHIFIWVQLLLVPPASSLPASSAEHPIHIANTDINFNPATGSLETTHYIFLDDIQLALIKRFGVQTFIGSRLQIPEADSLLRVYMNEVFLMEVNSKRQKAQWVGWEADVNRLYVYQEFLKVPTPIQQVFVQQGVLMNVYDDQSNLVNLDYQGKRRSTRLLPQQRSRLINFN